MPNLGVVVVVLRQETVLLTQREDFQVWCLPGGAVDAHETVADAAVREVLEETGVQVELTQFVGLLSRPHWGRSGTHIAVFAAHPMSAILNADPHEVHALDYFPIDALPEPLMWDHRHLILAACAGFTGQVWVNAAQTPPIFADRAALYAWRDENFSSHGAAYAQLMVEIGEQTMDGVGFANNRRER